jgi:hypothetical protein
VNSLESKRILLGYRPGTDDAQDPAFAQALEAATRDPELRRWLEEQRKVQAAIRAQFRQLAVPDDLRHRILEANSFPAGSGRGRMGGYGHWLAAAAIVVLLGVIAIWDQAPAHPGLTEFRGRMVRTVLREYRMDIHSGDMDEVRTYLRNQNAPADYRLPPRIETVPVVGGGRLTWQDRPVSMVCFNRGDGELLFLFVIEQAALPDSPGAEPEFAQVNRLMTASWTAENRAYILAGELGEADLRRYF